MDIKEALGKLSKDDLLHAVGLEAKRSTMDTLLPAFGVFAAGVAIGAVLGLVFAPKSGRELRVELGERASDLKERLGRGATKAPGP